MVDLLGGMSQGKAEDLLKTNTQNQTTAPPPPQPREYQSLYSYRVTSISGQIVCDSAYNQSSTPSISIQLNQQKIDWTHMGWLLKPAASLLLMLFLVSFGWQDEKFSSAGASRPLPFLPQQRYSKIFASLGVVCKCCDGAAASDGEHCATTWTGACSDLQCLPWKLQ
ncbi:uncharacterized protein LOC113772943 [Coffea eugenioides]|uniref:uncharacterized protein LOC113772943 n=1 Tax=Coffea eugenioides TaxID=49369 RepID=UPI000F6130C1|nr:uncharacterized protein LOC113772943 [Coffea eugenioides]